MAVVTLTTPCTTKLTETLSLDTNTKSLHDASISSFLNKAGQELFSRKLAESDRDLRPVISMQEDHKNRFGVTSGEVGELGVFGAEKYFNGVIDHEENTPSNARKIQCQEVDQLGKIMIPTKMKQPGTPSVRSESSWNSQSALLNNSEKNPSRTKNKKGNRKSILAIFGCKCSCYDKNSVAVQDQVGEISFSTKSDTKKGPDLNAHPIKKPHSDSWFKANEQVVKFPSPNSNENGEAMLQRKSLEVFGSPVYEKRSKSLAVDPKKLPRLSWDANAKVKPEREISGEVFSDCESDASSDLFELDSITGITNQTLDHVTSTIGSAPSEASIEWSVITASAAHFSTISVSDYEIQDTMSMTSPATHYKAFPTIPHAKTEEMTDMPMIRLMRR